MNAIVNSQVSRSQADLGLSSKVSGQTQKLRPAELLERFIRSFRGITQKTGLRFKSAADAFSETCEAEALKNKWLKQFTVMTRIESGRVFGYLIHASTGVERLILEGDSRLVDEKGFLSSSLPGHGGNLPRFRAARDFFEMDESSEVKGWARFQSNDTVRIDTNYYLIKIIPEKYRNSVRFTVTEKKGGI